jgi:ribonuclease HII
MLLPYYQNELLEAGCDEAGRGCLAGPVFAAVVILPKDFHHPLLNDSKQINKKNRDVLRQIVESEALHFAVAQVDNVKIDEINILKASILAMHLALEKLASQPKFIIIDGNKFYPYNKIPHQTIVKGDSKYASIAAASILAKTYRDEFMENAHQQYPEYNWLKNQGYPTKEHRAAIAKYGTTPLHRLSYKLLAQEKQIELFK